MNFNCFACTKNCDDNKPYFKVGLNEFCSVKCARVTVDKFLKEHGFRLSIWRVGRYKIKCVYR